jgi:O-antigen ligase
VSRFAAIWVASACVSAAFALEASLSGSVRPTGLATHSNHFALIAALALGPALAFAATGPVRQRTLGLGAAAVLGAGVLVSGSRSGLLAFAVAGLLVLAWVGSRRLVLAGAVALACAAVLIQLGQVSLPQENALDRAVTTSDRSVYLSDTVRTESRRLTLELIEEHPLTGAGFESALLAHNVYFQLLVIGGPLALAGFLLVALGTLSGLRRLAGSVQARRAHALAGGLAAAFAAFVVGAAYQNALWDRHIWVTAALAAIAAAPVSRVAAARRAEPVAPVLAGSRA